MRLSNLAPIAARARGPLRAVLLLGALLLAQQARADLMLFPTRVVFEKNQRAAQIELINNGAEPATYRLSLVNRRMSETGEFKPVEAAAAGELFADPMLRFSPRQVTVQPGAAANRAHHAAQAGRTGRRRIPLAPAVREAGRRRRQHQRREPSRRPRKDIGVVLTALVGASVPVIVRHGATAANVTLSQLELGGSAAAPSLAMQFERSGNASVYGDLNVSFLARSGAEHQLGKMGGIAVYAPNPLRRASLALQPPSGLALAHGTLVVTYRERADAGGKPAGAGEPGAAIGLKQRSPAAAPVHAAKDGGETVVFRAMPGLYYQ